MKHIKLLIYTFLFCTFFSCSPKLKIYEIEKKINENHIDLFEGNVEALLKNIPKKYSKEQGENNLRERLNKRYKNRKYPIRNSQISGLNIQNEGKCNSYKYYKVDYVFDKSQMTPYLDSIALKRNEEKYGKKNVNFNPNSKILHIRHKKTKILILDKDENWKILNLNKQSLSDNYGVKFWNCIKSNDNMLD